MKALCHLLFVLLLATAAPAAEKPAPAAAAKAPVKKKLFELPTSGLNQPRPGGGWINAEAVGTQFVLKFFDVEKKPVPPDVERGFARFKAAGKNPVQAVLNREGPTLVTPATVRPPHNYLVILSLFKADGTEPSESLTFKYP